MGKIIFAVVVVGGLVWGQMDSAADELAAEQQHYCDMVAEGSWPDFKGTFDESCK